MIDKKTLEEIVFTSPLVLLSIKDKETIDKANNYLPYSTGFEIECDKKKTYDENVFKKIPNIIWDSYQSSTEQRYRIPNGINGLICLYNICYHLGNNSLLNMGSGIHYHVDCTDTNKDDIMSVTKANPEFANNILEELEGWKYHGKYNSRAISGSGGAYWIRWSYHNTLEFRIGNMSFDYEALVKQIIHANNIVRRWKNMMPNYNDNITYNPVDYKTQIEYQKVIDIEPTSYEHKILELLQKLDQPRVVERINTISEDDIQIVKKRLHKLY